MTHMIKKTDNRRRPSFGQTCRVGYKIVCAAQKRNVSRRQGMLQKVEEKKLSDLQNENCNLLQNL